MRPKNRSARQFDQRRVSSMVTNSLDRLRVLQVKFISRCVFTSTLKTRDIQVPKVIFFLTSFRAVLWIPGDPFGVKRYFKAVNELLDFVDGQLKKREATFDESVTRGDYIDAFFAQMKRYKGQAESTFTCSRTSLSTYLPIAK